MTGDLIDKTTLPGALKFFVATAGLVFIFVIAGLMMSWSSKALTIIFNLAVLLVAYMIFWNTGTGTGADAVNQGEIMLQRQEKGRPVADWERSMCYHPWKGLVSALIGSLPLVIASVVLALLAQRQMTSIGALPSWVGGLETRPEIGDALAIYHAEAALTLESALRVIIRMSLMPFVNMIGAADRDAMLILERVSPLLNLLPAVAYGLGYRNGVQARSVVHTNIALGKKKQKQKQRREKKARMAARKGPEQLN